MESGRGMHAVAMSVTTLCSVSLKLDKVGSWTSIVQDLFCGGVRWGLRGQAPGWGGARRRQGQRPFGA